MLGYLFALAIVFLGICFKSQLFIVFGFAAFFIQAITEYLSKPVLTTQTTKPRLKHKLINAPEDAWKTPEEDAWIAMMSGPSPMSIGGQPDFMNIVSKGFKDPHAAGILRGMLPFQNYGRQGPLGALENIFIGFPISIGNFLQKPGEHVHFPYAVRKGNKLVGGYANTKEGKKLSRIWGSSN